MFSTSDCKGSTSTYSCSMGSSCGSNSSLASSEALNWSSLLGVSVVCNGLTFHVLRDKITSISMEISGTCSNRVAYEEDAYSNLSKRPLMVSKKSSIFYAKSTNTTITFAPVSYCK